MAQVSENSDARPTGRRRLGRPLRWAFVFGGIVIIIVMVVLLGWIGRSSNNPNNNAQTYTVTRGDLLIAVTEDGDIKAVDSLDIKSEVEGRTTIISIVDEGTTVTPEDVNNGMILVELDSADIKERLTQQEIKFLNAEASFTEAKESLDIQKKQNESDVKNAQMKVRFALMDLKKYLGDTVADKILSEQTNQNIDPDRIAGFVHDKQLGGEALQKLRELQADIELKKQELEQAKSTLEWTEKLYDKNYVSRSDLEADTLKKNRHQTAWEKALTAKDLFIKYEFPKEAEKRFSDYNEAKRELERAEAGARSKLAQAQARLESTQATYALEKELLEKWQRQLEACIIKAPVPGQVVYSSSLGSWWEKQYQQIKVGSEVRERQKIISIPDYFAMKVEIKVHENWIDNIDVNQPAKITVAAFPDETFTGKVMRKSPLADPEHWMNPDLKVYSTDISIDGTHESLRTGMTAKVEIIIEELKDVISVPVQAVVSRQDKKVCYVLDKGQPKPREVETGMFNDNFVEIKAGLAEGEQVLLNPPRLIEPYTEKVV